MENFTAWYEFLLCFLVVVVVVIIISKDSENQQNQHVQTAFLRRWRLLLGNTG